MRILNQDRLRAALGSPWQPAVNGLTVAAGVLLWADIPLRPFLSLGGIFVWVAANVGLVLAAAAITVFCIYSFLPIAPANEIRSCLLHTARAAVWLPSVFLFYGEDNTFLFFPGVFLALAVGEMAAAYRFAEPVIDIQASGSSLMFLPPRLPARSMAPFLASTSLQGAAVAAFTGNASPMAGLMGVSVGIVAWALSPTRLIQVSRRSIMRFLLTCCLAILVTALGLMRNLARHDGFGPDDFAGNLVLRVLFGYEKRTPRSPVPVNAYYDPNSLSHGGMFSGVVLQPQAEAQAVILAPPPQPVPGIVGAPSDRPMNIPFRGEYWFFKPPNTRPPDRSYKTRGDPVAKSLHSSDEYPLLVEAHQDFSYPVSVGCCSEIEVAITNADPDPGTVWLELVLSDRSSGAERQLSLGRRRVNSRPEFSENGTAGPAREVLTFTVPATPLMREFDELIVRYRPSAERWGSSPRVAIDSFLFVPRGAPAP